MSIGTFRILLIDDDEDDYVVIKDLLRDVPSWNYELHWQSTYEEGLKALRERSFDACLLDYKLGEKTGLELLSESDNKNSTCPIIFLTGLVDFEIDIKAMQIGASDYLAKEQLTAPLLERSIRYSIKQRQDLEEIKASRAQILQQDRLASLGLLASSLAHEIGTPMGIIRSRAELAGKRAGENEVLKRDMDVIVLQTDRVSKLVHSLLHLAREKKSVAGARVELSPVLRDVLNLLEHEFQRKNIELTKDVHDELSVKAEAGPLGQVLLNLLINAIQAIEEARSKNIASRHAVVLKASEVDNNIYISIQDSGIGITPEHQTQLFKPFFTTKDIGHGTGLGLATSYKIVDSWGGRITVTSKFGAGSTFTIILPRYSL